MRNITLTGNPMSTQSLYLTRYGTGQRVKNPKAQALKLDYQWQVKSQWRGEPIRGNIIASMVLYFGDKRKHDIDNFCKIALDSLTGIVWEDDSQIQELTIVKEYDKNNPRIEIIILTDTMCNFCGTVFNTEKGLNQHRRVEHEMD